MFNRKIVKEVLKRTLASDFSKESSYINPAADQDSVISMLIHDIFGGEILKTHNRKGWYFYNRINGERIDFSESTTDKFNDNKKFEDIPTTPDETSGYFDKTDYSTFFMRFIRAFEEAIGLEQYRQRLTA
jgi:hypothetical protein